MLKKTVTYTDYNGVETTEDLYFNLSKAELAEMQLAYEGGFDAYLKKIIDSQNSAELMKVFKDIIVKSYGHKSDDGKRFIKNDALREEFQQTEAYSTLFMELISNADAASEFISGIVPSELGKEVKKEIASKAN